jgi:cyanophycinase
MRFLLAALLVALGVPAACPAAPGSLVIVGGGLSPANAEVHRAFLGRRPSGSPLVAIVPSASGVPAESARAAAEAFIRHGARAEDLVVVHLAAVDDPGTPDIDESRWAANAGNPAEIAKLQGAGAIWFTGGDQLRTTRLLAPGGRDTPMLATIRKRLAAGAVIGGSSAGAAIMSRVMITSGDTLPALARPVLRQAEDHDNRTDSGELVLGAGLGFLPAGLVDQHFDTRARLGRLARALFELPPAERFGFGIDEDTALVADLARSTAIAIGRGSVTLLDARRAVRRPGERFGAEGLRLGVAGGGDSLDLLSLAVTPAGKKPVLAGPSESRPTSGDAGGMAVPAPPLADLLADGLSATGAGRLDRSSFAGGVAVRYSFTREADSRAFEGRDPAGSWRRSLGNFGFAISPLQLELREHP